MKPAHISLVLLIAILPAAHAASGPPLVTLTLLNQDPNPAPAGETLDVRFRVENTGGATVEGLELEMLEEFPFTVTDGPALQALGALYTTQKEKKYATALYTLRLDKDAVKGRHPLKVRYRWGAQPWITATFSIDVTSHEFAQIIFVDKAKLEPGKETEMKFTITNIGSAPLKDLVFSWSEADGAILPVFSDDTKYIKYLDIGDSVELTYTVIADVNANPGLYQLDLRLKYGSLTNTTPSTITTRAGVFVGGETDFDVAFSESTQGQTSLSVANTGNTPALSVSVRIPEQSAYRVLGSNSAIIGNLDKGDYTIVSFQIVPSGQGNFSGGSRQNLSFQGRGQRNQTERPDGSLRVLIDYTDTTGERRTVEKSVPIQYRASGDAAQAFRQARAGGTPFWRSGPALGAATAAVLLAGAAVVSKRRRGKVRLKT